MRRATFKHAALMALITSGQVEVRFTREVGESNHTELPLVDFHKYELEAASIQPPSRGPAPRRKFPIRKGVR